MHREPQDMEQGVQLVGCGICAVLCPTGHPAPCPICGGGARFQAAQMMSAELVRQRVAAQLTAYAEAGAPAAIREAIAGLCGTVHVYGTLARAELSERGHSVDDLRAAWEAAGR